MCDDRTNDLIKMAHHRPSSTATESYALWTKSISRLRTAITRYRFFFAHTVITSIIIQIVMAQGTGLQIFPVLYHGMSFEKLPSSLQYMLGMQWMLLVYCV